MFPEIKAKFWRGGAYHDLPPEVPDDELVGRLLAELENAFTGYQLETIEQAMWALVQAKNNEIHFMLNEREEPARWVDTCVPLTSYP